jgi:hypothetical protein
VYSVFGVTLLIIIINIKFLVDLLTQFLMNQQTVTSIKMFVAFMYTEPEQAQHKIGPPGQIQQDSA